MTVCDILYKIDIFLFGIKLQFCINAFMNSAHWNTVRLNALVVSML